MKQALFRTLAGSPFRQCFSFLMRERATIFFLHRQHAPDSGVHGHSIEFLRASLGALRDSGARFVSVREIVEAWRGGKPVGPNWVAFTIDDGFADQATLVREAFAPMSCPVTIFLIAGFLDRRLWPWDDQLALAVHSASATRTELTVAGRTFPLDLGSRAGRSQALEALREHLKTTPLLNQYEAVADIARALGSQVPVKAPPQYAPMSWDTARQLEKEGVDFGPHSVSHRIFSRLADGEARLEIGESWRRLREELANPLPVFAWPTGRLQDFSARDAALARELGMQACVSTVSDYAHFHDGMPEDDGYRINRFPLPDSVTSALRYGSWIERARQMWPG